MPPIYDFTRCSITVSALCILHVEYFFARAALKWTGFSRFSTSCIAQFVVAFGGWDHFLGVARQRLCSIDRSSSATFD